MRTTEKEGSHVNQIISVERDRAATLTELLSTAPEPTDHGAVREFLHGLAAAGCAVLLIAPGTKVPADCRTKQAKTTADKATRDAARAAGDRLWSRRKSPAGVYLASADPATLDGYLEVYAQRFGEDAAVNVAIVPGRSGLVVVDCDTAAQTAAFLAAAGLPKATEPTVRSPGQRGPDGAMVHKDGGHFWFAVPDGVVLPEAADAVTLDDAGGYAVLWGAGRYVLIPPSVRPEGPYEHTGDVDVLPGWLAATIADAGTTVADATAAREHRAAGTAFSPGSNPEVTRWGAETSWAELLADAPGWTPTGAVDGCGCEVWTAPGLHASPKSATAHEPGCGLHSDSPDPPMHLWTDHDADPFGDCLSTGTVTRLQAAAAIYFDNDMGAAMTALDDARDTLALDDDLDDDHGKAEAGTDGSSSVPVGVTLPASFWESRASLRHIRDAALIGRAAPDATLAAGLARIAASTPPRVTVDTGIMSPIPLNFYAAAVSWSGRGKTSSMSASGSVLDIRLGWSTDPLEDQPVTTRGEEEFPHLGKIRSGEGIAEAYWGEITETTDKGKPVKVRCRVRSNVLMHTDEASSLVKYILDPKQTVGETLREAWSGATTGQSNAEGARYRLVREGTYRLGLIAGSALSVLAEMLTADQVLLGTPQRFYAAWAKPDPGQVDRETLRALADPGPLTVTIPATGFRLCATLRARVDEERIAEWLRDDDADNEPDIRSQRVSMVARIAGLLAILDGRTDADETGLLVLNEEDWQLAETMFDTSAAIMATAVADRRRRAAAAKRQERTRNLAAEIEDDEARSTPEGRATARILGYFAEHGPGPHRWSGDGILRRFNQSQAKDAEAALEQLAHEKRVLVTVGKRRARFVELVG